MFIDNRSCKSENETVEPIVKNPLKPGEYIIIQIIRDEFLVMLMLY